MVILRCRQEIAQLVSAEPSIVHKCVRPKGPLWLNINTWPFLPWGSQGRSQLSSIWGPSSFPGALIPVALILPWPFVLSSAKYRKELCALQRLNKANCLDRNKLQIILRTILSVVTSLSLWYMMEHEHGLPFSARAVDFQKSNGVEEGNLWL